MKTYPQDDIAKMRMMAAQMRHHAVATSQPDYIAKFNRAAAELERKAEEVEKNSRRRLDS